MVELGNIHAGRVVLVGDAAHARSPMMGQGGCMAMGDACVLVHTAATVEAAVIRRQSTALFTASSVAHNVTLRE